MPKKRIVVTGLGVVSCYGNDIDLFFQNLLDGKSGISPITTIDAEEFPTRFAGEIKSFDPEGYLDKKQARRVDRCIAYAAVAGKKALEDAGINPDTLTREEKERAGILIGSGIGGMKFFTENVINFQEGGLRKVSPFFVPYILTNMPSALLAMEIGFMGPNYSISTACATGNNAIIAAAQHIRQGDADLVICGGTEASINKMCIAGFTSCKALSQRNDAPEKAARPWDRDRDGFVLGEGCGVIILESLEHALARGAKIYAEYRGGGLSCDAHHITDPRPDGEGVFRCLQRALQDAEVNPKEVDYINAHATCTPAGDMAEVRALKRIIAPSSRIKMSATKSLIGHGLGAAGGFEAITTVKTIEKGIVHPTLNLDNPEPELEYDVPTKAEKHSVNIAISNSFGFGGHNATVVFGAYRK